MGADFRSFLGPLTYYTISETLAFRLAVSLKYVRARLQYEVAQQPRLLEHLPTPLIELLQTTLDSHRLALMIDQDNADLLLYAFVRNPEVTGAG